MVNRRLEIEFSYRSHNDSRGHGSASSSGSCNLLPTQAQTAVKTGLLRSSSRVHECTIASSVMAAVTDILAPARRRRVEGIAYFLGRTDGVHATILSSVAVSADATFGSFFVPSSEMVRVVNAANAAALQVVGQIHTHPHEAFHSAGDDAGAQIRFDGFITIVVPDYGMYLPSLRGSAVFAYSSDDSEFARLPSDRIHVVESRA